jgi:hypothetical protein
MVQALTKHQEYVAFKREFTYSPAVITSYFDGRSEETQLGIGLIILN